MSNEIRENDTDDIKVQKMLLSINNVTLKIREELELIKELVKENGHLCTVVDTTNLKLGEELQKMGISLERIMNNRDSYRLEPNLLRTVTSTEVTEQLLNHMDTATI